ncbi:MAG: tRNA (N6-threonylcarbamoyladenosine(37)-N6)-methyltransferase TrmO [Proteobacteria bacterium]|nr:tRNA (N6-threonylcarbamoyladenosine(37)-N6)-methyltransferase TrmO [Pseudomonadota bacterium]
MPLTITPIGTIHTPFKTIENMPIQPRGAVGIKGQIELYPEFVEGLKDLDGFSHAILLYHFHKVEGFELLPVPFLDTEQRGVFATRSPKRPNAIGLSIIKIMRVDNSIVHIEHVDMLDKTPLLDIKPYVPEFDHYGDVRAGWFENTKGDVETKRSDERFK